MSASSSRLSMSSTVMRSGPSPGEEGHGRVRDPGGAQGVRGDVDRHPRHPHARLVPPAQLLGRLVEDEPVQGAGHAQLVGDPDEPRRGDRPALGVGPARQHLDADHGAGRQVELGLVDELDLAAVDRDAQGASDREPLPRLVGHRLLVEHRRPGVLGPPVGDGDHARPDQGRYVGPVPRRDRDADGQGARIECGRPVVDEGEVAGDVVDEGLVGTRDEDDEVRAAQSAYLRTQRLGRPNDTIGGVHEQGLAGLRTDHEGRDRVAVHLDDEHRGRPRPQGCRLRCVVVGHPRRRVDAVLRYHLGSSVRCARAPILQHPG